MNALRSLTYYETLNMTDDNKRPPSRATTSALDALHLGLADTFSVELERCRKAGEAPSAQFLAQLRSFLKDNSVDVPANDKRFDRLKGSMPDMDALERGLVIPITRAKEAT